MKIVVLVLIAILAYGADDGVYIEADAAVLSSKNDVYTTQVGVGGSLAVGYQLEKFRFELQAREFRSKLDGYDAQRETYKASGDMDLSSQFVNLYFSGYNKTRFVSTIGLGVGQSRVKIIDVSILGTTQADVELDGLLSYQASYSVGYMLNEDISYIFRYNYLYIDNDKDDEFDTRAFGNHMFSIGIRYLF
jgi:hypothetical protein